MDTQLAALAAQLRRMQGLEAIRNHWHNKDYD